MPNRPSRRMMEWRLRVLMAERGIESTADLQRKLAQVGISVSSQNLSRLTSPDRRGPLRVSSELMYGLTRVLTCTAGDLWVNPEHPEKQYRKPLPEGLRDRQEGKVAHLHVPVRKRPAPPSAIERAVGPAAEPFPEPED